MIFLETSGTKEGTESEQVVDLKDIVSGSVVFSPNTLLIDSNVVLDLNFTIHSSQRLCNGIAYQPSMRKRIRERNLTLLMETQCPGYIIIKYASTLLLQ